MQVLFDTEAPVMVSMILIIKNREEKCKMLALQARKVCIVELCSSVPFKAAGLEYGLVKLLIS